MFRDFICNSAWVIKGRLENIHNNFGLHSYTNSQEVDSRYHFNQEERVNFLLDLSDRLGRI